MRQSWDAYFMAIAQTVATRATCDRAHVGAIIVLNKTIVSTGYNGAVRSMPHCNDVGHLMQDGHCVRSVHAEANAIVQAAKNGANIDGATIYTTHSTCWNCFKLIANSGIKRIVYSIDYSEARAEIATDLGIEMVKV